jgi:phospholipase C
MKATQAVRLLAAAALCAAVATAQPLPPVRKVVVLMQENRSFDHLLGFLKRYNPNIEGLNGNETNPYDPKNPAAGYVTVSDDSGYVTDPDPGHGINDVTEQTYGTLDPADQDQNPPPMNGYVKNYAGRRAPNNGADVMKCFNPDDLPISTTLALEFGLIDQWFCSVPGPTMPNRYYLMSATSNGVADNAVTPILLGFPQKSLFKLMEESGYSWASYFGEVPTPLVYKDTRRRNGNFHHFSLFAEHAAQGLLPELTLIDPRYFGLPNLGPNDDHPDHDVSLGQQLMKDVYEALRASPDWEQTLFVIVYDEHGGFYDHFPVPTDVPNPDGLVSDSPAFDFTRLGPRVPAIFISPWIERNTVVHTPNGPTPTSQFDHASLSATMKTMFNLTSFLNRRDAWAGNFDTIFSSRTTPRTDCPMKLPEPIPLGHRKILTGNEPLSQLQEELAHLAAALNGMTDIPENMTKYQASRFVRKMVNRFFGRNMYPANEWDPAEDWNN